MNRKEFLKVSAAVLGAPLIPSVPSFLEDDRVIVHGDRSKPQVALTFDDGFLPWQVEKILRIADDSGLKFTFFPVGWRVLDKEPDLWRAVAEKGHEIENHSHSHRILRSDRIKPDEMAYDILLHQVVLDSILGYHYPEKFFRPPGGYVEPAVLQAASDLDLRVVKWSLSSGGTGFLSTPDSSFHNVSRAKNGDIVLLHCINNDTQKLSQMIDMLQTSGLELVTLSDLIGIA